VLANGGVALLGGVLHLLGEPALGWWLLLGSQAALGADTIATEIGTRHGGVPRRFFSHAGLHPGTSGGVTRAGTLAAAAGAWLAPLAAWMTGGLALGACPGIAAAGFLAGLVDSALGDTLQYRGLDPRDGRVTEERRLPDGTGTTPYAGLRWLDNDAVNAISGAVGGLLALLAASLLRYSL
jgi:uncharacterized membrane protein